MIDGNDFNPRLLGEASERLKTLAAITYIIIVMVAMKITTKVPITRFQC